MIGPDGKNYPVPANYASKSKLVEGDIMKLTITEDGKFLYKQIGPVERKTVIGTLTSHDDQYFVEVMGKLEDILAFDPVSLNDILDIELFKQVGKIGFLLSIFRKR